MVVIESINHIGLTVSSIEKSIQFFKDLFDFEVVDKYSTSQQTFLKMGEMMLCLYECEGFRNTDSSRAAVSFYIDEEDFEDALDELDELGMEIVYGPENLRGGKSVIFVDPDDNRIELSYPKL